MAVRELFGECEIRRESFSLLRRSRPVKIEPKVFDVLLYLVDRRDRVVTKHELLDALWPGEAVSDSVPRSSRPRAAPSAAQQRRRTSPGNAPVCLPSSSSTSPFTMTWR